MFTIQHLWWIPSVIIYYFVYSWLSKQSNMFGGSWIWTAFIFGALCPFWIIVTRISKNLLFDGMLYDNIMFLTYVITMILLKEGRSFDIKQWVGLALIVVGSVLIRS